MGKACPSTTRMGVERSGDARGAPRAKRRGMTSDELRDVIERAIELVKASRRAWVFVVPAASRRRPT
jgi:hypothetical protein